MPLTTGPTIPPISTSTPDLICDINDRLRRIQNQLTRGGGGNGGGALAGGEILLSVPGTLGIRSNAAPLVSLPNAMTPFAIVALLKQAPSGAALTLVLKANGSTYTTLAIASGQTQASSSGTLAAIPANAIVTLDVTGAGTTFPGSDLTVEVRF